MFFLEYIECVYHCIKKEGVYVTGIGDRWMRRVYTMFRFITFTMYLESQTQLIIRNTGVYVKLATIGRIEG